MKRILSITIKELEDNDADLSYLGKYSNNPGEMRNGKWIPAIDRKALGHMRREQFRYFIPAMTEDETGNPESIMQDYSRMEEYGVLWGMVGIKASAQIQLSDNSPIQTIESGGLWGIESDSSKEYLQSVKEEELFSLLNELRQLEFNANDWTDKLPFSMSPVSSGE